MAQDIMKLQNGSDIRGIALHGVPGEDVNLTSVEAGTIASAFVQWLSTKVGKNVFDIHICVGHDPRLSGEDISAGLKKGICMMGAKVSDAGLASTPAMFMSTIMPFWEFDGAIMVTASHLPFNRNGLKFFTAEGGLDKGDIKEILTLASKISFIGDYYECDDANVMDMYAASLRQLITQQCRDLQGMKIAVDAGNGSAGFFARDVLAKLGADITCSQFLDPDGNFPNHQPNPENPDAMDSICKRVIETGADLGIIFDTDVDRSSAVTPSGKPLARNEIVALAAALVAADHPGGTVVTDSVTSNELHDFLENELGLKHLRFKRGYKNVINKALELREAGEDAFLAIETSGHAAYSDNYLLDDGAYLAVLIVIAAAKLKKEGKTIDALIDKLASPAESIERRFNITCEDFQSLGTKVLEDMSAWVATTAEFELVEPNYEGIRVNYSIKLGDGTPANGWFLLRKSLHDPVLPLNIESDTEGGTASMLKIIEDFMSQYSDIK